MKNQLKKIQFLLVLHVGTKEAPIIEVLAHRTIAQRQRVKEAFKQAVGKVRDI